MGVFTSYLGRIRAYPVMHLGVRNGTALYFFLAGFEQGLLLSGNSDLTYGQFKEWLSNSPEGVRTKDWLSHLLSKGLSEEQAFDAFFSLWDSYVRQQDLPE